MATTNFSVATALPELNITSKQRTEEKSHFQAFGGSLTVFIVLYTILIVIIIICNSFVIVLYSRMVNKVKMKIPNILLLNQSLVDLLIGLSSIYRIVCAIYCSEQGRCTVPCILVS